MTVLLHFYDNVTLLYFLHEILMNNLLQSLYKDLIGHQNLNVTSIKNRGPIFQQYTVSKRVLINSLKLTMKRLSIKKPATRAGLKSMNLYQNTIFVLKVIALWSKNTFNHKEEDYRQTRTCR